jgi:hypothetical protein
MVLLSAKDRPFDIDSITEKRQAKFIASSQALSKSKCKSWFYTLSNPVNSNSNSNKNINNFFMPFNPISPECKEPFSYLDKRA